MSAHRIFTAFKSRACIVIMLLILFSLKIPAAPLYFEPVKKILPDGKIIDLFVSGDEFFNWLHDKNGFPVGEAKDGNYYYMLQEGNNFYLTEYRAGTIDPHLIPGIKTVTVPSYVAAKRVAWQRQIEELSANKGIRSHAKSSGTVNNLVIYIRFSGESEFTIPRTDYDTKMNSTTGLSMRNYYREISYNKLDVVSHHMPGGLLLNLSYQDANQRKYYQPYNSSTNPAGYKDDNERGIREHTLLANAISWVKNNYQLPEGVNFDYDDDGKIDNVCFIIRGATDGWSDLLWPHRWVLYNASASIGGLGVWGYTLQLENVAVTTLSHEMFHALGAPDLYHYNNSQVPVGQWDIMASGKGHPGAWMKYNYGKWISSIPEITASGTYSIKPLTQPGKNSYLLRSPYSSNQFFILEYRKAEGSYESNLPSSGLIITRIDNRYRGNANGPPDEIYVYRFNGTNQIPGTISQATFSASLGRGEFSDFSNPTSFLQDGTQGGINIKDIITRGDSMIFTIAMDKPLSPMLTSVEDTTIDLQWKFAWSSNFMVAASNKNEKLKPVPGKIYNTGDTIGRSGTVVYNGSQKQYSHSGLISDEPYFYSIFSLPRNNPPAYSEPALVNGRTGIFSVNKYPYSQNFDWSSSQLPRGWKLSASPDGPPIDNTNASSFPNSALLKSEQDSAGWLYTPGFSLSSYQKYMITFRYRNIGSQKSDSLFVRGGTLRHGDEINGLKLFSDQNFRYRDFVLHKAVFRPHWAGINYFGFRIGSGGSGVLIDDFRFEVVPLATTEHSDPLEFYPNPTNGRITVPATEETTVTVYRSNGIKAFEMVIESMQEIDLSFLGKGLFMVRFSSESGSSSGKLIIL
jgi:M6 family metalloprotease-like protein